MSNSIKIFENRQFGQIRTINKDGEPWFVAIDIANNLGYQNGSRDINRHVDETDRSEIVIHDGVQNRRMTIINESGVYGLIFGSTLPTAKEFKHWVSSDVLPSIRKHGMYATDEVIDKMLASPEFGIRLLTELQSERQARIEAEEKNRLDAPKVLFADAVSASKTSILVGDLAKIIKQNGVDIGANRLFKWLRDNGYLIKRQGMDYNMPTQTSMDMGLFSIKETVITHSDGHTSISKTAKVTGKGQQYFVNKFIAKKEAI